MQQSPLPSEQQLAGEHRLVRTADVLCRRPFNGLSHPFGRCQDRWHVLQFGWVGQGGGEPTQINHLIKINAQGLKRDIHGGSAKLNGPAATVCCE